MGGVKLGEQYVFSSPLLLEGSVSLAILALWFPYKDYLLRTSADPPAALGDTRDTIYLVDITNIPCHAIPLSHMWMASWESVMVALQLIKHILPALLRGTRVQKVEADHRWGGCLQDSSVLPDWRERCVST